jgi:archaellum component FlaF (FlaF/FlaG flagellin family)
MIDSTTYFLAYFYPRVTVYDDYVGWDLTSFTDQQEFYNDFNDYSFTVNAPKNYIVWATGDLQNPSEVLQPAFEKKLAASMTADAVTHIADTKDLAAKNITAQQPMLSWKWKADHISDVTIGLSDHYVWDASSVQVDDVTHRRASVQAAYNDKAKDFKLSVENANYALSWFSRNWPGVPYPFSKMTAFQGFADMEYPMMVNDASTTSPAFARLVQDHEIAHSYFPFYMGINESRYAFMDEGWATTLELLIGRKEMDSAVADNFYKQFRVNGWINDPSTEEDIPIITPASVLNGEAYGNNAYGKPSLGYLAMKDMLGDDLFRTCLHEYMARWHGKHPIPWDFFYSFNNVSGRNLNWFWSNWYFSNNYIDLAIQQVSKSASGYTVNVQNIGGYVAPFNLQLVFDDGTTITQHATSAVWQDNQKSATIVINSDKKIQSVKIDGGIFMDANPKDNVWKP